MADVNPLVAEAKLRIAMASTRMFDIFFSVVGIIVFSPVLILIATLILLSDGPPILFSQIRIGYHRFPFVCFKFRTMRDTSIIHIGRWMRSTGLDELPQFLNVLIGDMSMVGPRPLTLDDIERLGWDQPQYSSRWSVKPGITGLAQIFGDRGAAQSWAFDKIHIRRTSRWLDLRLILISAVINIYGKRRIRSMLRRKNKWAVKPVLYDRVGHI